MGKEENTYSKAIQSLSHTKKKLLLLAALFCGAFLIGTLGFMITKYMGFIDAFVHTLSTLAFLTSGETGIARVLQIFLLIFGVFLIWFTLWTTFDILLEGHLKKHFTEVRIMDKIKKLKNHYLICGGGRVGEHIAEILQSQGKKFVVIESNVSSINNLKRKNCLTLEGDALEESLLLDANIKKAKALIAVLPETEKNILVTLNAKQLCPKLKIYARASKKEYIKTLKSAGANYVVMPELSCAEEIIKQAS